MSIRVMTEVWLRSSHKGSTLLLLLAIADFADDNGYAYPAVDTLATKTRMSERNTQYAIRTAIASGELAVQRGAGPKGANRYRIMIERNLPLFEGGANFAPGAESVTEGGEGGCKPASKGVQPVAPEPSGTVIKNLPRGAKSAPPAGGESAVAKCWQTYRDGIKRLYGTDYPPSATVNGKLARLVALVGKENAPGVVGYYLGSGNPWYKTTKHKIDFLLRDAAQLCMDMQQAAGSVAGEPPATSSRVMLVAADGSIKRDLGNEFPVGEPLEIARRARTEYSRMFATLKPAFVVVRQGAKSARFSPQELST